MAAVGRTLGVDRSTIWHTVHADENLILLTQNLKEEVLDDIENNLIEKALAGHTAEMLFYLRTQGKGRGYTERIEQDVMSFEAMKSAADAMTIEQRQLFLRRIENGEDAPTVIRDLVLR